MPIRVEFDTRDLLRSLPRGQPEATVRNVKRTRSGLSVYRLVDRGRGPVRPVRAKALRIPTRRGVIFRRFAGPARPQNLTEQAVAKMNTEAARSIRFELSHGGLVGFLNTIARVGLETLRRRTPRRGLGGGRQLADSFEIDEAR